MAEKIVVGPINKGLKSNVTPFNIDNDSFPFLVNAYQWRGRIKRKRGTSLLGRLNRYIGVTDGAGNAVINILPIPIATGIVSFTVGSNIFTDPGTTADPATQTLLTNGPGTATLNRVTGVLTITGSNVDTNIIYYPSLPVMGLEDLILNVNQFPGTLAFDTDYSYNIDPNEPHNIWDVSFYKNPISGLYTNYVAKTTWTPTTWNGQDYQQFWTVNYQGALWATNGINIPFSITNIGMQYAPASSITYVSNTPTTITVTIANSPLVVGDFVFLNEWTAPVPLTNAAALNFQTGYITSATLNTPAPGITTYVITLPNATLAAAAFVPGIIQYLTNRSDVTKDGIRWYDGDPTGGSGTVPSSDRGWVNFAPPISQSNFSIADLPARQYYLVGARMIIPFKDRLLFIGVVVQTSAPNSQVYLQDTVVYSQNGTPYYTASFTNAPTITSATTLFHGILLPLNQTATATAYFADSTGFGGFVSSGVDQKINTTSPNGDVLIMGFDNQQSRFVYTGNDIIPFEFYTINSELGSSSTFSAINMDEGVLSRGNRGYVITSQTRADRFDLEIPDEVFQANLQDNGTERITAQRDYISEWVYFTYKGNQERSDVYRFPNQTLQYNYRDQSWAIFNESYTTYGQFKKRDGYTWSNIGETFPTWIDWTEPWNAGTTTLFQPQIIAGNQQGFVLFRDDGTGEGESLTIQNITGSIVNCPNHCLIDGDYILISDVLGTVGTLVNGKIFKVTSSTQNAFTLNPPIASGTYLGGGLIKRMYVPFIQTKQFPVAWGIGRKTRIGTQQYLLSTTENSQIALQIFLSQNDKNPYTSNVIVPNFSSPNNALIYTQVLYTCPESTNLGLTPANTNLQMPTAPQQSQIWHRVNTSLIGDTVQLGFTMSDAQMRDVDLKNQFAEIELHGFIIDVSPSMSLS